MRTSSTTAETAIFRGALTVNQFCQWAAIGRSSFYKEVKEGRIRLRKLGSRTVVTMADAEAWLASLPVAKQGGRNAR